MTMLELEDLTVRYGGVVAVREVSLSVQPGQVLALLGANGAGKTSTLRAVTGLEPVAGGRVLVDGVDVTGAAPDDIARRGVAHVPAGRGIFANLSVSDNLRMGLYGSGVDGRPEGRRRLEEAFALFPGLVGREGQPAGQLSGGQQQQLAVARALVQAPRLLLVDEMSMGLAPTVVDFIFDVIAQLSGRGIAVVMVEQFVGKALRVCDQVAVLEQGRIVAAGRPADLSADDVAAAYLGGSEAHAAVTVPPPPPDAREGLRVDLGGRQVRELERLAAATGTTVGALLEGAAADVLRKASRR
ncbi:MAG TPA: ABC transporter ATP-binding protein [Mycobacteriales bacterium]|nr:ABC transporter ATP-binding protein [Mycobacteriales bacterium]